MGSVDTSFSDLVTIIVKAPNQQIADQTIQCHLSWSIKKLKDYLSEVYPSNPKLEEQKLIYSGKLLTDSAILKDVLRMYEGQENHTVHLVCTSKSPKLNKPVIGNYSLTSTAGSNETTQSNSSGSASARGESSNVTNRTSAQHSSPNPATSPASNGYIFSQINSNQFPSTNNFDSRYFWPGSNFININEVDVNQQFAMMQHAYAQYVSQYMQMMGQPGYNYMPSHIPQATLGPTSQLGNAQNVPPERNNQAGNQARENAPAVGAVANEADDEEGRLNRDWLDWFYVFSRVVVLFSVVYFYSTPLRLLAVLLLVCMFYLHQNLRMQHENLNLHLNNNNNNVINHNNQNNNNHDNDTRRRAEDEDTAGENGESEANTSDDQSTESELAENVNESPDPDSPAEPQRLSPISVTLLAIRTFFLSLVPDQPAM